MFDSRWWTKAVSSAWLGLCACSTVPPSEFPSCEEEVTVLDPDEPSALQISGADALALAEGTHEDVLQWARDGVDDTALTVTVAGTGVVRQVLSTAVYPEGTGDRPAIGVVCDDRLEIDVDVELQTDDGAFDESWSGTLLARIADATWSSQPLDPTSLGGGYDIADDIVGGLSPTEQALWVEMQFDASGARGAVRGRVAGEDPCDGEDCAAWTRDFTVGSWGGKP